MKLAAYYFCGLDFTLLPFATDFLSSNIFSVLFAYLFLIFLVLLTLSIECFQSIVCNVLQCYERLGSFVGERDLVTVHCYSALQRELRVCLQFLDAFPGQELARWLDLSNLRTNVTTKHTSSCQQRCVLYQKL